MKPVKLIAHRGWNAGKDENSLAAFARAAGDDRISGVEFDVRRNTRSGMLVVSHDPPDDSAPTLESVLAYLAATRLELLLELKEPSLAADVIDRLVAAGLAHRSVVFAFPHIARSLPWRDARPARLGIIALYPWSIGRIIDAYAPDVVLLGWDERAWTRRAFRAWWSIASLPKLSQRHRVSIVVGVAQRHADFAWLARQDIEAAVADTDRIGHP